MEKKAYQKEIEVEVTVSGMLEEGMKLILDFDHRAELSDRYYEEAKDYGIENRKVRFAAGAEGFRDDPIDCIPDPGPDVFEQAFPEPERIDPRVEKLLIAMEKLSEDQRNLLYGYYGSYESLEEIGESQGVSRQAIFNRKTKALNRLRKLMLEG